MTRSRSPSMLSSRVIGRSSQSGPLQGVVTLGTIGQMALFVSSLKCQHYYDSGQPSTSAGGFAPLTNSPIGGGAGEAGARSRLLRPPHRAGLPAGRGVGLRRGPVQERRG